MLHALYEPICFDTNMSMCINFILSFCEEIVQVVEIHLDKNLDT